MLANGHPDAIHYPIGRVFDEAKIVVERQNGMFATLGILLQSATMTTGMSASKEAGDHFKRIIEDLNGE